MKHDKEHETETTLIYEWILIVKNAGVHNGRCLFFYSLALPRATLCVCVCMCESAWAYGCGFVNYDSMLWNEGSGASSFFAEL